MHLLVIGATGPSGLEFVDQALKAGHELTIYARSPDKLPQQVQDSNNVHVVKGDFSSDDTIILSAVTSGTEVVVSFAGPVPGNKNLETPVAKFYERFYNIVLSESASKIRRALILSTASYTHPSDGAPGWVSAASVTLVKYAMSFGYKEMVAIGTVTAKQPVDKLGWTLFRVPFLTNGVLKPVHAVEKIGSGEGSFLSRKSQAAWLLQELQEAKYVGKAVLLWQ